MAVIPFPTLPEKQISVPDIAFSRWLGRFNRPIAPTQVALDGFGRAFVVYEAQGGFGLFGRIVFPDGTMLPEIVIEQGAPYFPHSASVAWGTNCFAVVYRREGESSIQARLYNLDGTPKFQTPVTIASDSNGSSELAPTIVISGVFDAFVVAWNSGSSNSGYRIKYSILYVSTQSASNAIVFGEETSINACVQVVMLNPIILAKVYQVPSGGNNIRIEACQISSDLYGDSWSGPKIPSTLLASQGVDGFGDYPAIASGLLTAGSIGFPMVITWHDTFTQKILYTIRELRWPSPSVPGSGWTIENRWFGTVNQFGPGSTRPSVAVVTSQDLSAPKIIIAWEDAGFGSIRARVFNHDGVPETNEFVLHEHSPGGAPSIISLPGQNRFYAAWTCDEGGVSPWDGSNLRVVKGQLWQVVEKP